MKKIIISSVFVICLFITNKTQAQFEYPVKLPNLSQKAKIYQEVGVTEITIEYNRPLVKNRQIFGKLVPYRKVWRTGANKNTSIKFSTDVTIDGKTIKAGKYGLHTIPNKDSWTIILNNDSNAWGSYFYDKSKDAIRFSATPKKASHHEFLTFNFNDVTKNKVTVEFIWAETSIAFDLTVNTDELTTKSLKSQLNSRPWWGWTGLYNAAKYCLDNDTDYEDGLKWINRSIQNNKNFSNLNLKSQLLEKQGKTSEAEITLSKALKIGSIRDLQRAAFFKFRAKDKKSALEILKHNIINRPKNYQSYSIMAWGHTQAGDKKRAVKMYKKALKLAPKDKKDELKKAIAKLK